MEVPDKGRIHALGRTQEDDTRSEQWAIWNLSIFFLFFGIFHLIFSGHVWPWVTKTMENQTADTGFFLHFSPFAQSHQPESLPQGRAAARPQAQRLKATSLFSILKAYTLTGVERFLILLNLRVWEVNSTKTSLWTRGKKGTKNKWSEERSRWCSSPGSISLPRRA